eukprot:751192-Prymnesium_polylepis.1
MTSREYSGAVCLLGPRPYQDCRLCTCTGHNRVSDTCGKAPFWLLTSVCAFYGSTGCGTRTGHASGTRNRHGGAKR